MSQRAITVGVFDGVHIGHQFLIDNLITIASNNSLTSLIINFELLENKHKDSIKQNPSVRRTSPCRGEASSWETQDPLLTFIKGELDKSFSFKLLTDQRTKEKKLRSLNTDEVLTIPLTQDFMNRSAVDFLEYLLNDLQMKILVVGDDFAFGKDRVGNINWLKEHSLMRSFELIVIPRLVVHEHIISSTFLRTLDPESRSKYQ